MIHGFTASKEKIAEGLHGTVCIVASSKQLAECTLKLWEKQAAAIAILGRLWDVFSLLFFCFFLIFFLILGVETYAFFI